MSSAWFTKCFHCAHSSGAQISGGVCRVVGLWWRWNPLWRGSALIDPQGRFQDQRRPEGFLRG